MLEGAYQRGELSGTVTLDDGTTATLTFGDGTFSFLRHHSAQGYDLELTTPLGTTTYQLDVSTITILELLPGRLPLAAVPPGTNASITLANRPPSPAFESVGSNGSLLTYLELPPTADNPILIDWSTVTSRGLPEAALHDALYYLAFETLPSPVYSRVSHVGIVEATLVAAQTTGVSIGVAALPPNTCARLDVRAASELSRVKTVLSGTNNYLTWQVAVAPTIELAARSAVPVAIGGGPPVDSTFDVSFPKPFSGGALVASLQTGTYRTLSSGLVLFAETFHQQPADGTCNGTRVTTTLADGVVAMGTNISLGTTPLQSDYQSIEIDRSQPVTVTWTRTAGHADGATIQLFDVTSGYTLVKRLETTAERARFAPALIQPGHSYVVGVVLYTGFPNAPSGDFKTTSIPQGYSYVTSSPFVAR